MSHWYIMTNSRLLCFGHVSNFGLHYAKKNTVQTTKSTLRNCGLLIGQKIS